MIEIQTHPLQKHYVDNQSMLFQGKWADKRIYVGLKANDQFAKVAFLHQGIKPKREKN